ncbi:hypothetical protein B9Z19DRAFT_1063772 [Tuber borchii]|uniref:Uncharacterized protein n=1 Tax=Tuber borchii TaxID=42251 RepID=A0A2T6ZX19_TUBBO|nr:hypothetical protein B9Z19DRAFT_1063772 [Tuber borchii]
MSTRWESPSNGAIANRYNSFVEKLRVAGYPRLTISTTPPSTVPAFPDWLLEFSFRNNISRPCRHDPLCEVANTLVFQIPLHKPVLYANLHPLLPSSEHLALHLLNAYLEWFDTAFCAKATAQIKPVLEVFTAQKGGSKYHTMQIPYKSHRSAGASKRYCRFLFRQRGGNLAEGAI